VSAALRLLAGVALAWSSLTGMACAAEPWVIVTADETMLTRRIADDLQSRLRSLIPAGAPARPPLSIAIGPEALRKAAEAGSAPLLSAFTASQVWHHTLKGRKLRASAVFGEPAPADQMHLVELLYRRPTPAAAILSADNAYLRPVLGQVRVEPFEEGGNINRALNRVQQAKVLLAMPDRAVFSTGNIRNILLSAYRRNQGVIGFSADMVKAGALATTYSEIEDINAQVAEMTAQYVATGELPGPQFPRYFRTIVNEPIARSLGIKVDDKVRKFSRQPLVGK
jgi:hypothetical protein